MTQLRIYVSGYCMLLGSASSSKSALAEARPKALLQPPGGTPGFSVIGFFYHITTASPTNSLKIVRPIMGGLGRAQDAARLEKGEVKRRS